MHLIDEVHSVVGILKVGLFIRCHILYQVLLTLSELQDLRMSPIPSIRNRFGGRSSRNDQTDNFPPSFRINRGYSTTSGGRAAGGLRRSASGTSSALEKARQSRLLSQLKKGTSTLKAALPRIKDVNIIDKYSRVIFPVSFLVFNIAYWCFYVLEY